MPPPATNNAPDTKPASVTVPTAAPVPAPVIAPVVNNTKDDPHESEDDREQDEEFIKMVVKNENKAIYKEIDKLKLLITIMQEGDGDKGAKAGNAVSLTGGMNEEEKEAMQAEMDAMADKVENCRK